MCFNFCFISYKEKVYFFILGLSLWLNIWNVQAQTPITLTGHIGAAGHAPENTISSIQKALSLHVDRVEVDVQQSSDGVVVLMHDVTLQRTTNAKGKVKSFTYAELQQLDAGSKFSSAFKGEKIPTLEDAFACINGKAVFVIELKKGNEYYPQIVANVVRLIQKYDAYKWCIIHSFEDKILQDVHALDPAIALHSVVATRRSKHLLSMPYLTEISIYHKFLTPKWLKKIHSMGKKVNVWTVNTPEDIQKMREMQVDGIISNFPDRLQKN